jgi:lipoprotein-releasing system ATP-binding protein
MSYLSLEKTPLLAARGLVKSYRKGRIEVPVLGGVDLDLFDGEFLAITGQSGSGKSTLLHLLATLDRPDAGQIHFEGHRIDQLPAEGRDVLRNKFFGIVFQFYHLLPELTTLENVLMPRLIGHGIVGYLRHRRTAVERAKHLLDVVGLSHRLRHRPRELSGGEMQRAAIARAVMAEPRVLLADEPTGNLDRATGEEIIDLLRTLNGRNGLSIVMVTHDAALARQAHRTVRLAEGLVQMSPPASRLAVA